MAGGTSLDQGLILMDHFILKAWILVRVGNLLDLGSYRLPLLRDGAGVQDEIFEVALADETLQVPSERVTLVDPVAHAI